MPMPSLRRLAPGCHAIVTLLTLSSFAAADARGQRHVSIRAPDGGVIEADHHGSDADPAVVLVHGGRFDRSSWRPQATVLVEAGFQVLAIDLRASVAARAGDETPCLYDPVCLSADVLAAVRYLRDRGVRSVSVIGASLGGGAAAQASVDAPPGEIERVVLLAPLPIEAPESMQGRKLFIASRDDLGPRDVPRLPAIREQYERSPGPKQLVVLDGAAHAQFVFETDQGERLMREILRFLTAT